MDVLSYALSKKYTNEQIAEQKLKVAKVEKELNDYKSVMAQANINQEAKQKASGYGIIPLPKNAANGQVSDVVIKGQTVTNLVKNGNFADGTNKWSPVNSTHNAANNILTVTGNGTALNPRIYHVMTLKPNNKYYAVVKARVTNDVCTKLSIYFGGGGADRTILDVLSPVQNQWYVVSGVVTTGGTTPQALFIANLYSDAETANGKVMEIKEVMTINMTAEGLDALTVDQMNAKFPHWFDGTKSTFGAGRVQSTDDKGNVISELYYIAKDKDGNIIWLGSVPSANDEIDITRGKLIRRTGKAVLNGNADWNHDATGNLTYRFFLNNWKDANNAVNISPNGDNAVELNDDAPYRLQGHAGDDARCLAIHVNGNLYLRVEKNKVDSFSGAIAQRLRTYLNQYPITLIYQLATPIEKSIQTSGSLVSYPSGTVYIEPFVADAGIYTDKMSVLHQDLPIKALEKISKVDFETGMETELDVSETVIAGDKLSFTHPDLEAGDIVFFVYEYDRESTVGETEIEYYDSRYVVKDDVTEKFYKWAVAVADGVPSIQLTEV